MPCLLAYCPSFSPPLLNCLTITDNFICLPWYVLNITEYLIFSIPLCTNGSPTCTNCSTYRYKTEKMADRLSTYLPSLICYTVIIPFLRDRFNLQKGEARSFLHCMNLMLKIRCFVLLTVLCRTVII